MVASPSGKGFAPEAAAALEGAAADLRLLCRLHDREPDADLLHSLASRPSRDWFAIQADGEDAETGHGLLDAFLAEDDIDGSIDPLAADFADLYLTFAKRVAPNESYWLTEDHLERQEPMFSVRSWFRHYGLAARDWRKRADDHLVPQLEFIATLIELGKPDSVRDAGRFLDQHLLLWSKDWFGGVATRAETAFFAGLALISQSRLEGLRTLLELVTGEPRKVASATTQDVSAPVADEPNCAYVPGTAPGW
jgi:TorA maturation chaperone TorD